MTSVTLHFPYAWNTGGIWLPFLLSAEQSLFHILSEMFSKHHWHIRTMTATEGFDGVPFLYLTSCSVNDTNLRTIEKQVKQISFYGIRQPGGPLSDRLQELHELRRQLFSLRDCIDETLGYMSNDIEEYYRQEVTDSQGVEINNRFRAGLRTRLVALQTEANTLHVFIMETFNILTATIALTDSRDNARQTRQSILLTFLAAVYLPLSLATGIFGMNIYEINDGNPRFWAFLATTAGLAVITVGAIWGLLGGDLFQLLRT
jgi:Mg2+ and Co2+ transporter CorA